MRRGRVVNRGTKRAPNWSFVIDAQGPGEPRKQHRRSGFRTRAEAQSALNDVVTALDRDNFITPSKVTVAEFAEEWLRAIRSTVRPSTHATYATNVRQHVIPEIGTVLLQRLTADRLNALYADLLESGRSDGKGALSPKTVRNIHVVVHRALRDAVRWGRTTRNVADLADPPKMRATKRHEMKTWDAQELSFYLTFVEDDDLCPMWHLDANTGLRRGELVALRWGRDVDLNAGRISVTSAVVLVNYVPIEGEVKTDRSRRTVALDAATVRVLRDHRKAQLEHRLAMGYTYEDNDLVFARPDGSPIHPQYVTDRFDRLVKGSGLPRIRLHDLRHTHATLALKAGVPVKVVSERLGHASTSFTMDTYQHVLPGMQEDAAELVAALVAGARDQIVTGGPK